MNTIYLIVDTIDYVLNRFGVDESLIAGYHSETDIESFFKWGICLLYIFILFKVLKKESNKLLYFSIGISVVMIIYYFTYGPFVIITSGSFVHHLNLIYIVAIITLIYSIYKLKIRTVMY
ncbi:hypothetical protein C1H87_15800 [Flavivirga eckloniae]|uniref:Uncharacterized protein n=2 Tax=Flavivirga eckloniae TaxID=1803846 RepID=A0A2K9PSP8_9FLAO|nr:hypothetical protein C1H87_15800 [Flavivirga eckloniae]